MKILIATDGSAFSDAAVVQTCRILEGVKDAAVKIVSVFEQPIMAVAAPYAVPAMPNLVLETELRETAEEAVAGAEKYIREQFPNLKVTTAIVSGSPQQTIVAQAEDWSADLIVVGSHGYGFWERVLLGSVSSSVAHHAPCSVLIVRKTELRVSLD
jgi:nucleotide-binding universal stress UspA family protein